MSKEGKIVFCTGGGRGGSIGRCRAVQETRAFWSGTTAGMMPPCTA